MDKKNIFQHAEMPKNPRSTFDLSHSIKQTFEMGRLVPNVLIETLPNDRFNIQTVNFNRFLPLITPPMHEVQLYQHFFFVPYRILAQDWEEFITNGEVPSPFHDFETPGDGFGRTEPIIGRCGDYLGLPPTPNASGIMPDDISTAPIRAYFKIFDEYYRDQNIFPTEQFDEDRTNADWNIRYNDPLFFRAWKHDYFTSCLPFAQKGGVVEIPILTDQELDVQLRNGLQGVVNSLNVNQGEDVSDLGSDSNNWLVDNSNDNKVSIDPNGTYYVDFEGEVSTIQTLRRAFRLQEWLERNARGGTRYIEMLLSHFGAKSSDARLQRPEYLGGSKQYVDFTEVLSTNESTNLPLGQLGGHGITVAEANGINYSIEEHGLIMGIASVLPEADYSQGLHRMHNRKEPLDYYWPSFADIGEQGVLNKELYYDVGDSENDNVFGYIPRYAEYKHMQNRLAGLFRADQALEFWHLGRKFGSRPTLNSDFINCEPSKRIFADQEIQQQLLMHMHAKIKATREMPYFGNPSI